MKVLTRSVALAVVLSLLQCGAAVRSVAAQQPTHQVDLLQEAVKVSAQGSEPGANDTVNLANVGYVPGKAVICVVGALVGVGLLALTVGTGYQSAAAIAREGCGGTWVLQENDFKGARDVLHAGDRQDPDWDRLKQ